MKYALTSLILSLFTYNLFAAASVDAPSTLLFKAGKSTSTGLSLIFDEGLGTDEASAPVIYVPFEAKAGDNTEQIKASGVSDSSDFPINPENNLGSGDTFVRIYAQALIDDSSTYYPKAAVKDSSSNYQGFALSSGGTASLNASSPLEMVVSVDVLCEESNISACTSINETSGDNTNEGTFELFFYMKDNITVDSTIDPASVNGFFVELRVSDRYPLAATNYLEILNIRKGDTRLNVEFIERGTVPYMENGDEYRTVFYRTIAPGGTSGDLNAGTPILRGDTGFSTAAPYFIGETFVRTGDIDVKDLNNNEEYCFSVAFMNKFQFLSPFQNYYCETPLPIQAFIEEIQCYFMSAGFGEDHYVLDYFRSFRDNVLLKNKLGKTFVKFYYGSAPKYVKYIYESKVLSALVRGLSFALYYLINYFFVFLLFGLGLLSFIIFRKRQQVNV